MSNKQFLSILPALVLYLYVFPLVAGNIMASFDHTLHDKKVFSPTKFSCSKCHNFSIDPITKVATNFDGLKDQMFVKKVKDVCHQCHSGAQIENNSAPKTCFSCHRSIKNMKAIEPINHQSLSWKRGHALKARVNTQACLRCHTVSKCVKCHVRRDDLEMNNHSRNYRYFHSVEARLAPQRCDKCHQRRYCVQCHLGRR